MHEGLSVERLRFLRDAYKSSLLEDTLPFWLRHGRDFEHGGVITSLDADGTRVDMDKGIWQQARTAWLFAKLFSELEPCAEWIEFSASCIQFLEQFGADPVDGRFWFLVDRCGRPLRKRRYAFSEAFASIAFAAYSRATGESVYAKRAIQSFERYWSHHVEPKPSLAKFTDVRPKRSLGFPMIAIATAQELRQAIGWTEADDFIKQSIDLIERFHVRPEWECVVEEVGVDGHCGDDFSSRTLNPGHAIEGAWFILEEGIHRQRDDWIALGCRMLDWMWERGWDEQHGGILYFVSRDGRPIQEYWHDMKFWWPQNEAIIATLMAYRATGEERYARWHTAIHDWAHQHFPDPAHGEWFGYLHRDGRLSNRLKGSHWKGPFHLPRMQWKCWELVEQLLEEDASRSARPN